MDSLHDQKPTRQAVSTRTRFEILERDGFRCRYCGATSVATILHVDHVIPVAEGGTNDHTNLVAACAGCNLGKAAVPLDSVAYAPQDTSEDAIRVGMITDAIAATSAASWQLRGNALRETKYFHACLRRLANGGEE